VRIQRLSMTPDPRHEARTPRERGREIANSIRSPLLTKWLSCRCPTPATLCSTAKLAEGKKLISQAWVQRAWEVLGYTSWEAYVDIEFAGQMLRVPMQDRPIVVRSLQLSDMKLLEIAKALGVSLATAQRAAKTGVSNGTSEPPVPPKPKPKPKPDRYLEDFYRATSKIIEGTLDLGKLCEKTGFDLHRDALIKDPRDNMLWAYELLLKLVEYFGPDITQLDEGE
jgi:hypothetical protein